MKSLKDEIEESLNDFAEPMKQAIKNLGYNIQDTIDDLKYAAAKDKHSDTFTKENSGCLKKILVYGIIIIVILVLLVILAPK